VAKLGPHELRDCERDVVDGVRDQSALVGIPRGLRPVRDAELSIDVSDVELDRLAGNPQLLRDRVVREPPRERLQDGERRG
jgi:hypothetical protein